MNNTVETTQVKLNIPIQPQLTKFQLLCKRKQIHPIVAQQLYKVLSNSKIVLLCDDSSSMGQAIAEQGNDPFAIKQSTRWLQLKKLASQIIQICTATNQEGIDLHFLNRPSIMRVNNQQGLADAFFKLPDGGTPLCGALKSIFSNYSNLPDQQQLLLLVITDGEPSDGSRDDLFNVLKKKNQNVHVSFAECTDNQQDMEYLDRWDGLIPNFDNTDDYRQQLARVKAQQGINFKFDYGDYVIKILLATFVRWYFNLDQAKVNDFRTGVTQNSYNNNAYQIKNKVNNIRLNNNNNFVLSQNNNNIYGVNQMNSVDQKRVNKDNCCQLI